MTSGIPSFDLEFDLEGQILVRHGCVRCSEGLALFGTILIHVLTLLRGVIWYPFFDLGFNLEGQMTG